MPGSAKPFNQEPGSYMSKFYFGPIFLVHGAAQLAPKLRQQQSLGGTRPAVNMNPPFACSIRLILSQVAVFFALQLAATAQVVNQSYTTGQLVINPGAEAVTNIGGILYPTGWTNAGAANFVADSSTYDISLHPRTGSYQFVCGQTGGPSGHIYQNIDITSFLSGASVTGLNSGNIQASSLATIASGTVTANLSFWQRSMDQGGWGDYAAVTLKFLDAAGNAIGTYSTPYEDNVTGWTYCSFSTPVPVGTCTITYMIDSYLNPLQGSWMDAFVDDTSLTLSTTSVTVSNQTVSNNQLNLLVGGTFETYSGTTPVGWTSPDGYFHPAVIAAFNSGPATALYGNYVLQMGDPGLGTISQTFTTIPGATYTLSFNYADVWQDPAQLFYVQWNGTDISEPMVGTANAYLTAVVANVPYRLTSSNCSTETHPGDNTMNMKLETVPGLIATGTSTTLTFGGAKWYSYLDNVSMVLVSLPSQSIGFSAPLSQQYSTNTVSLRANASSGLPVTFSIISGPATVSGSNVTMTGIGHVVVRASQPGNASWAPAANVDMAFDISQGSQTISFATLPNVPYGSGPITLAATSDSGLPVTFSYVSGPANLIGSTLTPNGVGTVTVRASQAGNILYSAATPVNRSFNVTQEAQTISFGALADRTYTTTPFTVSASSTSSLPVSFSISSGPATIGGNSITINGVGAVTVHATQAGNALFSSATPVDQVFTVTQASQSITFGALSNMAYSTTPITLTATSDSGLSVAYAVTVGGSYAHVSGSTLYLDGAGGPVTVQSTQTGNTNYAAATPVSRSFTVNQASQSISFGALADRAYTTTPFALTASADSSLPVTLSVDSGPATITGNNLTITGVGAVKVHAVQTGNANYLAASAVDQTFNVTQASQAISFGTLADRPYTTTPFMVSATSNSGLPVLFSIASGPATIIGNSVTLTGVGVVKVHAVQTGNANYLAATAVDQTFNVTQASQTISFAALSDTPYSSTPIALTATATSSLAVTYVVTAGGAYAHVSGSTLYLDGAGGPVTIHATQAGNANYSAAAAIDCTFNVTQAAQTISFAALSDTPYSSTPIALTATATSSLAVTYVVTAGGAYAHVSGSTLYLDGAGGPVTIHATQAGNANYSAATAIDRTFNVTQAAQTITFAVIPGQAFSFSPISLNAASDSNLQVTFTVVSGNATLTGSSTLSLTGTGSITVRASQAGNTNYAAATPVDRTFNVTANIDSWRNSKFTAAELADPAKSGDTAIYGHDGLPNLVKYALGLNPKTDTTTVPAISSDGTYWIYTYSLATGLTDISVAAESTTDLTNWSGSGVTITLLNSANGFDNYKATRPISSAANAFFRLHVTY